MRLALTLLLAPSLLAGQARLPDFSRPVWTSPVEFTAVYSVRELRDGRVIVPDPGEGAVILLGADGRQAGTIGRRGGGPKEFQLPLDAFALPGDSTLINDREQARFLLIGPDAAPIGTIPWPQVDGDGLHGEILADGRGNLYFVRSGFHAPNGITGLLRWRVGSAQVDSLMTIRAPQVVTVPYNEEGRKGTITRIVPYDEGDVWAVGPSGEIAIIHPAEYRVEWRAPDGTIRRGAPIPYRAIPVTAEERVEGRGAGVELPVPATKPAVQRSGTIMSPAGQVWVPRYMAAGTEGSQWDIIANDGKVVRSVTLPGRRKVVGFGKTLTYVVAYDEDDIQHLEAYR